MKTFSADQILLLERIENLAKRLSMRVCLVGGMLRDLFFDIDSLDFDFVVEGDAIDFARQFASSFGYECKFFEHFLTVKLSQLKDCPTLEELDFATARIERYETPGSLPSVESGTLEQDFIRRDFTINAIALEVEKLVWLIKNSKVSEMFSHVLDPFNGRADLNNRSIRCLHSKSFIDDPTRIFRAARYAKRIAGTIEAETLRLIQEAISAEVLSKVSETRKLSEIRKAFHAQDPVSFLREIIELQVFSAWKILPAEALDQFVTDFERALREPRKQESVLLDGEYAFEVFLCLLIYHTAPSEREKRVKTFGLPRKVSAAILKYSLERESAARN